MGVAMIEAGAPWLEVLGEVVRVLEVGHAFGE
jgi:hypothetical protein